MISKLVQDTAAKLGITNLPKEAIHVIAGVVVGVVGFGDAIVPAAQNAAVYMLVQYAVKYASNMMGMGSMGPLEGLLAPAVFAYAAQMGLPGVETRGRGFIPNFLAALGTSTLTDAITGEASMLMGVDTSPTPYAPYGERTA